MSDEDLENQIRGIMRSAKPKKATESGVVVNGNVGNLSNGDLYIVNSEPASLDIPDHAARLCCQCGKATWRQTRDCIHCGYDLFLEDYRQRSRGIYMRIIKFAIGLAVTGLSLMAFSASSFCAAFFPKFTWAFGLAGLAMCGLAAKSMESAQEHEQNSRRLS